MRSVWYAGACVLLLAQCGPPAHRAGQPLLRQWNRLRPLRSSLSCSGDRDGAPRWIDMTNTICRSYFASAASERRSSHCVALPVRERYERNGSVCRPTGSGGVGGIAALYARALSSGFATKAGRSGRFGPNPKPDFSGDFHPASREIKQERRST
jgi:hypothetical protein